LTVKQFQRSLFQYVFDSSSLVFIERARRMTNLRRRRQEVILSSKVAEEVAVAGSPLGRFISAYPSIVVQFAGSEEDLYLRIRGQPGIDDGEASAIALALSRQVPLVIDDKRGRSKATNHGLSCLGWQEFLSGS